MKFNGGGCEAEKRVVISRTESTHYAFFWNLKDIKQLDNDDIALIVAGLEEVKKSFIKRLNTYLKKYGLSKINAWTYLVD